MANTSATRQYAAHAADQLSSPSCLRPAIPKSPSLNEKDGRLFWGGGGVRNMKKMRFFTTRRGMQQYIQGSQFASFQGGAVTPFLVLSMGVLG